ncbi:hypothetical protein CH330_03920 [candidate division WOR-3 bacterium JGI_Cruoil_03_51_56]|uniref:DUF2905 domain-containing protein n=1 Tax=candidate division WOR-3 bacterium JGI_Cruoil_03_51_56 TaxID=1973747 RepID=A0A235BUV2_UNCW3|nr:MAG: hypothetical protein CH330_03920 [candidate division WOR-3 bacterium JGI_Cruoil_03_51_56]
MNNLPTLSRVLVITGVVLILAALILSRLRLHRLPGDIVVEHRNLVIYIPIVSALIISLILTIVVNLLLHK